MESRISSSRELPTDRLATADAEGHRIFLYPADVYGRFRNWRNYVHVVLIAIFLVLPWIRIDGRQAMLLDILHRRFTIFGVTFWAHDAPMLVFVFGGAAIALAFVTALLGRVWCGWACPQTVFIDSLFRRLERWIEGDALARRQLDAGPWTSDKVLKKSLKWGLFLAVSLVITHSFLAYFIDTEVLAQIVRRPPVENPIAFTVMLSATALILFDFGWFREQFCTIACPYGRLQSVLMDEHSLLVAYDAGRGEPRRGLAAEGAKEGDCVNCYRCVQVCPTGIDIRRGQQLECIACTACIDACDEVMTRLKKPKGLIRYASLLGLQGKRPLFFRPRIIVYLVLLTIVFGGLAFTLSAREPLQATFLRAVGTPYDEIQTGSDAPVVINRFKVDFSNQSFEDVQARLELPETMKAKGIELVMPISPLPLPAGKVTRTDLFVKFPRAILKSGRAQLPVIVQTYSNEQHPPVTEEIPLVGPFF